MGALASRDTRRISFDNNFAMQPLRQADSNNIDVMDTNLSSNLYLKETAKDSDQFDDSQNYWTSRIDSLKNEHHEINKILEHEYERTIQYTNKLFETPNVTREKMQKLKPCFDLQSQIMKCYEDNPRQPLVCSAFVQAFQNYVILCHLED